MNADILTGKWNEMKGKIKETFGRLTDDDLMQMQGSSDRVVGVLQQRYGYSKEQAQTEWNNFVNAQRGAATSTASNLADSARDAYNDLTHSAAKAAKNVADKVEDSSTRR